MLAFVSGSVGGGRGAQPEWAYGMDREDETLRRCVRALVTQQEQEAGLMAQLRSPYLDWSRYSEIVYKVYQAVNERRDHRLEGWEESGFTVPMWRRGERDLWRPMSELAETMKLLDDESARKLLDRIEGDPALTKRRRMSPQEAWDARAKDRVKVGDWAAPKLLGMKLACRSACSDRLELSYKDDLTRASVSIYGMLDNGSFLERGQEYLVWVNPLNPGTAYVCDLDTRYLGTCKVVVPVRRGDMAGLQEQMHVVRMAESALRRSLAPIAAARQRERLRDRRHNLSVLGAANLEAFGLDGKSAAKVAADETMLRLAGEDEEIEENFD